LKLLGGDLMSEQKQKRVFEIELIKALAIIGMVFVHIYELTPFAFSESNRVEYTFGIIISFFGGIISGGAFMFSMGWGAAYSDSATSGSYLRRFVKILFLGWLVNIYQHWIPMLILPEKMGHLKEQWYSIFAVDIYPFAAMLMLYFALLKKLPNKIPVKVATSAVFMTVALVIDGLLKPETFSTGHDWADTLIGLFVRENEYSYFPLISWIAFPLAGFIVGALYRNCNNKKKFMIFLTAIGAVILISTSVAMHCFKIPNCVIDPYHVTELEYYSLTPINQICGCGFLMCEFAVASLIIWLTKERLPNFMLKMSKNVMHIYVAQWCFIGLLVGVIDKMPNIWLSMLLSAAVLGAAFGYSLLIERLSGKKAAKTD
jgi:uncharacterized membrane protein